MGIFCYYLRMKQLTTLITIFFISLLSSPSWGEDMDDYDLVKRDGLWYEKFTDVPFRGKLTGEYNGWIKNGKREGLWIRYHENGQLMTKGTYKDGKLGGLWEVFYDNGQRKTRENYKYGVLDGLEEGRGIVRIIMGDGGFIEKEIIEGSLKK